MPDISETSATQDHLARLSEYVRETLNIMVEHSPHSFADIAGTMGMTETALSDWLAVAENYTLLDLHLVAEAAGFAFLFTTVPRQSMQYAHDAMAAVTGLAWAGAFEYPPEDLTTDEG